MQGRFGEFGVIKKAEEYKLSPFWKWWLDKKLDIKSGAHFWLWFTGFILIYL